MRHDAETSLTGRRMADPARSSPERFEPDNDGGKLVHSEHIARYSWAATVAPGRVVLDAGCGTGYGSLLLANAGPQRLVSVDYSEEAVEQTAARLGERAEVAQADVRELPFEDRSFDLIVCFEVIEHIGEASRALAEFARTLRPEGLLLVSSPNPRLYLQGNPHHVHEFVPEELQAALEAHFAHVNLAAQRAWLGSLIISHDQLSRLPQRSPASELLPGTDAEGEGTYVLAAAGHEAAPLPEARMVVGDAFEVKWWREQVINAEAFANEAVRQREVLAAQADEIEERLRALEARLVDLEQDRARLLSETQTEGPQLVRALDDLQRARAAIADLQGSVSWKLTTPLRSAKGAVRQARRPHP